MDSYPSSLQWSLVNAQRSASIAVRSRVVVPSAQNVPCPVKQGIEASERPQITRPHMQARTGHPAPSTSTFPAPSRAVSELSDSTNARGSPPASKYG